MNIVETITNQISGPMLGQLGSLIGVGESSARSAVGAAVPSLLAGFSRMTSTSEGAQKLTSAVERFDPRAPGSMAGLLNERPEVQAEQGSGMLQSLLGSGSLSGIVDSLTGSFGLGSGGATKLLGFLTPTVLGGIARYFSGRAITPDSLRTLFSDQKSRIAHAVPAGYESASSAVKEGYGRVKESAKAMAESVPPRTRWLLPAVLGLALLALFFFLARPRTAPERPEIPDLTSRLGSDLQDTVGSVTGTLRGITDSGTAEAAVPKLQEAGKKLDEIRASAAQLPQPVRTKFDELLQSAVGGIKEQGERLTTIPGAGEKITPVLNDLMARFNTPVGSVPAEGKQEVR